MVFVPIPADVKQIVLKRFKADGAIDDKASFVPFFHEGAVVVLGASRDDVQDTIDTIRGAAATAGLLPTSPSRCTFHSVLTPQTQRDIHVAVVTIPTIKAALRTHPVATKALVDTAFTAAALRVSGFDVDVERS